MINSFQMETFISSDESTCSMYQRKIKYRKVSFLQYHAALTPNIFCFRNLNYSVVPTVF